MRRRTFCIAASLGVLGFRDLAGAQPGPRRVAVIGHTGRGDYGHGLDTVWLQFPEVTIAAVADANPVGLAIAQRRLQTDRAYADYREMLDEVRPEFVTICPRHVDQHCEMALAAIRAGVRGIYIEKPLCRTPTEADILLTACEQHGTKIAIAHRNRYHPAMTVIAKLIDEGGIGRLSEIRGRGKGDHRGGGEDLWVLGTHVMNLIHFFGGQPQSCSAQVFKNGRPVTLADVYAGAEGIGRIAGDEVLASYRLSSGIPAFYHSRAHDELRGEAYGLQLIGTEGIVNIRIDRDPVAHFCPGHPFQPTDAARPWIPISSVGVGIPETQPEVIASVHNHVLGVRDLIDACDHDGDPLCDLHDGLMTVEMCSAVFESHFRGGAAVAIPLSTRTGLPT